MRLFLKLAVAALVAGPVAAQADDLRIMTTGAPKHVVQIVAEAYAAANGHRITFIQDTAGGVRRRVEAGEAAEIIVATPEVLDALAKSGKVAAGSRVDFARTGVGIGIREGLAKPDISTVDAVKVLVANAPSIALPDPKAGGTSAIYLEGLFKKLGLAELLAPKARFKAGGYAADLVASGEAEIVFHQISEIRPVKGVTLVGPLPAEIQLITTYSAGLPSGAEASAATKGLMAALAGAPGQAAAAKAGMDPVN